MIFISRIVRTQVSERRQIGRACLEPIRQPRAGVYLTIPSLRLGPLKVGGGGDRSVSRAQHAIQAFRSRAHNYVVHSETGSDSSELPRGKNSTVRLDLKYEATSLSGRSRLYRRPAAYCRSLKVRRLVAERARLRALYYKARCRACTSPCS